MYIYVILTTRPNGHKLVHWLEGVSDKAWKAAQAEAEPGDTVELFHLVPQAKLTKS